MSDPWPPKAPEPPVVRAPAADAPVVETSAEEAVDTAEATGAARRSPNRRALVFAIVVVAILLALAALVAGPVAAPGSPTFPPIGATTRPAGAAAAVTRSSVVGVLSGQGLQAEDVLSPYRPAEAARLAAAPRIVLRAVIPSDPDHGRVVIYEFLSTAEATAAAQEQAGYVGSGVGQVQFQPDAQFVIRVVGSTVVFYAWSLANSPDVARAVAIGAALETLGFGAPVPG